MSSYLQTTTRRQDRDTSSISIMKNKKLSVDAISRQKFSLAQEFKEVYREQVGNDESSSAPRSNINKLRNALDGLLSQNKAKDNRLNELKLRYSIMKRDDLSGLEQTEKPDEIRPRTSAARFDIDNERKSVGVNSSMESAQLKDGRALLGRYNNVKELLEQTNASREKELEVKRMLEAKINTLVQDIKIISTRIGKEGYLFNMMEKRFVNLGNTEFAAKNKLTRVNNKLLSAKREVEKQRSREDNYFKQKYGVCERNQSVVEGYKDVIAKNLIYMEEMKNRKSEIDEKLEEVLYEEKQIVSKRQASEYILLYIDLLDSLENHSTDKKLAPNTLPLPDKSKDSIESPNLTVLSQLNDHDKRLTASDVGKDRDVVISKIAQFYDQHPDGTAVLVDNLLKIYHTMQLKEQGLTTRHGELIEERMRKIRNIEKKEHDITALQHRYRLVEDKQEFREDASPEHIRQREKTMFGKTGDYDLKSVTTIEFMVNVCEVGIQNIISKFLTASNSVNLKSGHMLPYNITSKLNDVEALLSGPRPDTKRDSQSSTRRRSITKGADEVDGGYSIQRATSISSLTPKDNDGAGSKRTDFTYDRGEEIPKNKQIQMMMSEEVSKIENIFRSSVNTTPEIVGKWIEKFLEEKWLLNYLTREDIKRVIVKFTHYYDTITEDLLITIIKELKEEARNVQRKRTNSMFTLTEILLLEFIKNCNIKSRELGERFGSEFNMSNVEQRGQTMLISEFVQRAHEARSPGSPEQNQDYLHEEEQLKRTEQEEMVSSSDSEAGLTSFRDKAPLSPIRVSTREAILDLHSRYMVEKRQQLASAQGSRSSSMPRLRTSTPIKNLRSENFSPIAIKVTESSLTRVNTNKSLLKSDEKRASVIHAEKRSSVKSSEKRGSTLALSHVIPKDAIDETRDLRKKPIEKKLEVAPVKIAASKFIPRMYYDSLKKYANEEEFKKRVIKDDDMLRKIGIVGKRDTRFDKKSEDCERARDYVPNFSLLNKYKLGKQKDGDQSIPEWWSRQDNFLNTNYSEKDRNPSPFLAQLGKKDDRVTEVSENKSTKSVKTPPIHPKRSVSTTKVRTPSIVQQVNQSGVASARVGMKKRKSKNALNGSFDDMEDKLFNEAVNQNSKLMDQDFSNL